MDHNNNVRNNSLLSLYHLYDLMLLHLRNICATEKWLEETFEIYLDSYTAPLYPVLECMY